MNPIHIGETMQGLTEAAGDQAHTFRPTDVGAGRALRALQDGTFYAGRNYVIYRSTNDGSAWNPVTHIPMSGTRRIAQASRLACRLLRHEVRALNVLADGTLVAATREWVYRSSPGELVMSRSRVDVGARPLDPPMTMTVGPDDRVLWGEYNSAEAHGHAVRLYVSTDCGWSYSVARVFEAGSILHLHNIVFDERHNHYWVLAGDHNDEPGIGRLSSNLKDFEWVNKGSQRFRAVEVFDFGDRLVYVTDTEKDQNELISLEKSTGRIEVGRTFEGSCIYACQFGDVYAITTTVEPSSANRSRDSTLWLSRNAEDWHCVLRARKDIWHTKFFQYGSIILPRGRSNRETLLFSGQAVRGMDGRLFVADTAAFLPAGA